MVSDSIEEIAQKESIHINKRPDYILEESKNLSNIYLIIFDLLKLGKEGLKDEIKTDFKTIININLPYFNLNIKGKFKTNTDSIKILEETELNDNIKNIKNAIKNIEKEYICEVDIKLHSFTSELQEIIMIIKKFHDLKLYGGTKQISSFLINNKYKLNEAQNIEISQLGHQDFQLLELFTKEKIKYIAIGFDEDEPIFMKYLEFLRPINKEKFYFKFMTRPTIERLKYFTKFFENWTEIKELKVIFQFSLHNDPYSADIFMQIFSFLNKLEILDLTYCIYPFYELKFPLLINHLLSLKNLKKLRISVGERCTNLISLCNELPALTHLEISGFYDVEENLKNFSNKSLFKLKELHFFESITLHVFPMHRFTNLLKFTISLKFHDKSYFKMFFDSLRLNTELAYLKISISIGSEFEGDTTFNYIFQSINSLKKLEILEFRSHSFQYADIRIGDLGLNSALKKVSLHFYNENICDFGAIQHSSLTSFEFDSRKNNFCLSKTCLEKINKFLDNCPMLKEVKIGSFDGNYEIKDNRIKEKKK